VEVVKLTKEKNMQAWQTKVVEERDELVAKTQKLIDFLRTDPQIETKEIELLNQQVQAMKFYIQTLTERTVYFKKGD
jgi:hypothetical protein